ncbi:MAG TPA: dihydrofolate reductase family protein [Cyclobacteriaceae bacterium]|nr:dihydrofolate reductase family protein [Cyclobacteriaceae bacterium]
MRKVILSVAVTLDGFIEGPKGEYDWCFTDQDYGMKEFMKRVDTIFYGRKCYEMMMGFDHGGPNPYAKMKHYVFSNTRTKPYEGTELISGDFVRQVMNLKNQYGKDIWLFGGAEITTTFINNNLVDEMNLAVHPVLLGAGKLLFSKIENRKHFKLTSSKEYSSGLVMLNYEATNS